MKKIIFTVAMAFLSIGLLAQRDNDRIKTLFDHGNISNGFYGGLSVNYSQLDSKDAFFFGFRGAWLINHNIGLGIAGYGFINDLDPKGTVLSLDTDYDLAGGYGGLLIEPIIMPKSPIHISVPIIIGAGGVSFTDDFNCCERNRDSDAFFVLEPGVELEFNIIRYLRISCGVYYRHTSNIELQGADSDVLRGFSTGITFKVGKF